MNTNSGLLTENGLQISFIVRKYVFELQSSPSSVPVDTACWTWYFPFQVRGIVLLIKRTWQGEMKWSWLCVWSLFHCLVKLCGFIWHQLNQTIRKRLYFCQTVDTHYSFCSYRFNYSNGLSHWNCIHRNGRLSPETNATVHTDDHPSLDLW